MQARFDDFEFSFLSRTSRQHHLKFHAMMGLLLAMGTLLLYSVTRHFMLIISTVTQYVS